MRKRSNNFDFESLNRRIDRRGHFRLCGEDLLVVFKEYSVHSPDSDYTSKYQGLLNKNFVFRKNKKRKVQTELE